MKTANKINTLIAILITLTLVLGCSGDQQAEANKIVVEANSKLAEVRDLLKQAEARNNQLFDANIKSSEDLKAYRVKMAGEAKEIVTSYEKIADSLKEISGKFDGIAKMNVSDVFKDYAKTKSEEFAKRAEAVGIAKGNAQAFIDATDTKSMTAKFEENNTKTAKLFAEAGELGEKATKIENDNPKIFTDAK